MAGIYRSLIAGRKNTTLKCKDELKVNKIGMAK